MSEAQKAKEFVLKLISINDMVARLQYEQMRFMRMHNVPSEALDCRIYIDYESYRELIESIHGEVTYYAHELATSNNLRGFKVYKVHTNNGERLLDVTVKEKD